jgi:hypothetical protein
MMIISNRTCTFVCMEPELLDATFTETGSVARKRFAGSVSIDPDSLAMIFLYEVLVLQSFCLYLVRTEILKNCIKYQAVLL